MGSMSRIIFAKTIIDAKMINTNLEKLSTITTNKTRSRTAVDPQHLKLKKQDISLTKN